MGTALGPLAALFFDALHPSASDEESAWYAQRLAAGGTLALDVMCGSGRVLVPLLERGVKVHGVDASPAMIARCEEKLAARALDATLFRQDVTTLNVPFRYGAAFVAGGAFALLCDPAEARAALERIRAHLVPPRLLLLDCRVPPTAHQRLAAPLVEVATVKLSDDTRIVRRSETTWTPEARLAHAHHRYTHRRGTQRLGEEYASVATTWYGHDDIAELVREAGYNEASVAALPWPEDASDGFVVVARG